MRPKGVKMNTLIAINEIVLRDEQRLNKIFVKQAIAGWDRTGSGLFALYITAYLVRRWQEYARQN